ncbi:MAG: methanogenesis marker 9 domain-containing protein [Methanomicrobiales archaeon]|nr:methanogenesis marker 9 domain-containing protein [Methanomicrobiales archaeon]
MSAAEERFCLRVNGHLLKSPIAIASMAGIVDASYVLGRAAHIGAGFIGGYSIDRATIRASEEMTAQGRKEFLPDDPIAEISEQVRRFQGSDVVAGVNLRGSEPESFLQVVDALGNDAIYEIDAHCRQEPVIEAGSGEYYLRHPDALGNVVRRMKKEGVTVSVKIRVGVADSDPALARDLWKAGADIIHVDLMDEGHRKLKRIRNVCPSLLIANNSIWSYDCMMQMFSHGADLVSIARRSDAGTLAGLDAAIARYADEFGWYNAPKQLCRGGDIRALTFCCLPVKNCPLILFLKEVGLKKEDYVRMKQEAVAGTVLENGDLTCFGSLAWCCKATSPCMLRDATLKSKGLSVQNYMREKRRLSDLLMNHIFGGR